jgi:hypothetical protein
MEVVAICCCILFIYFLDYLTAKVQSGFGPKTLFQINNLSRKPTMATLIPDLINLIWQRAESTEHRAEGTEQRAKSKSEGGFCR